ncbi:TIGR02391 family protein [Luteimonas gilva]|uniref:TIGR02391 family protein n=1 Tax=Luteimonas gilva TaxID=2572684 RepID=A0A4U5JWN0_9GAMM|nr:TIGR02391 family protein [Luteimonas gilva]TKR33536.1 TIGR02391 family protein [Luteimonas gilva]
MTAENDLAGIEYHGLSGITQACVIAIIRLIQCDAWITGATLLTCGHQHSFLLRLDETDYIAIKDGFTSGYSGEGPRGLAAALLALHEFGVAVEEVDVSRGILDRLGRSAMTNKDIQIIEESKAIRPTRWYDYIYDVTDAIEKKSSANEFFPPLIPFRLIDSRIMDLAIRFQKEPDAAIMTGYRRLEQILASKCGLVGAVGSKLFAKAFQVDGSLLFWEGVDEGEAKGRASLFIGAYSAFRNRRAHAELSHRLEDDIREFLLLNQLYVLEASSAVR